MPSLRISMPSESALASFAAILAETLPARAFVALHGDLGAGKTTLVKAVAAAVGIDPRDVVSPTFGLIHEHVAPGSPPAGSPRDGSPTRIVHADMYRLPDAAELRETGWEDMTAGTGWVFIEWPERITAALPADRLDIEITIDSPTARTLALTGRGPRHEDVVARIRSGGLAAEPEAGGQGAYD